MDLKANSIDNKDFNPNDISRCESCNLIPLFDLNYDPRLYLGDDLLSDNYKSLTVFVDGSWKNEIAYYDASKNKINYYNFDQHLIKKISS